MNLKEFESIITPPPFSSFKNIYGSNIFLSKACKKRRELLVASGCM